MPIGTMFNRTSKRAKKCTHLLHFTMGRPQQDLTRSWAAERSRFLGPMRLIACIEEPDVAKKILEHLGLRAEPFPALRAQAPPVTLELFPAS